MIFIVTLVILIYERELGSHLADMDALPNSPHITFRFKALR